MGQGGSWVLASRWVDPHSRRWGEAVGGGGAGGRWVGEVAGGAVGEAVGGTVGSEWARRRAGQTAPQFNAPQPTTHRHKAHRPTTHRPHNPPPHNRRPHNPPPHNPPPPTTHRPQAITATTRHNDQMQ